MDRRDFLKLSGLAGSGLLLGACEDYQAHLQAYGDRPPDLIPGEPTYYATACDLCPAGCGVMARVVEGRAIKVEGIPDHPVNHGGLCPLGFSAVQHQYHPDRFVGPDVRTSRGVKSDAYLSLETAVATAFSGARSPAGKALAELAGVSRFGNPDPEVARSGWQELRAASAKAWDEALNRLAGALHSAGPKTAILVGSQVRGHRYALLAKMAAAFGAPAPLVVEPLGHEALRQANRLVYGSPGIPFHDLANAGLVVVFGDNPFTTGLAPAHYTWSYGRMRRGRRHLRGLLAVVGTRAGEAAATADLWVQVKPGTHGAVAQALLEDPARGGISPALAAELSGAPQERIHDLIELWRQVKPRIAMGGGEVLGHTNAASSLVAINSLNVAAGSVGVPGGLLPASPPPLPGMTPPEPASYVQLLALLDRMRGNQVEALLLVGCDPFLSLPDFDGVSAAFAKVPFVASFSTIPDDGAAHADLVLPDSTFLERWGDSSPAVGVGSSVANLVQPAVVPFFDTRAVEDVVLAAAKVAGKDLGYASGADFYKAVWAGIAPDQAAPGTQSPWKKALRAGGVVTAAAGTPLAQNAIHLPVPEPPRFEGDEKRYPYHLLPVHTSSYRAGLGAHLPWLQEVGDPVTAAAWGGWAELHPETCKKLGVALYDQVEVVSPHGRLTLGVVPSPGVPEDVVGVPIGCSRKSGTRYDSAAGGNVFQGTQKEDPGRGADARALLAPLAAPGAGNLAWGATRVDVKPTGRRVPRGKLVLTSKQLPPQESVTTPRRIDQEFKVWPIG